MVSGSKLGLASSEEGRESTKVSGKSGLWPPGGFGGKRPHIKCWESPGFQRVRGTSVAAEGSSR